MKKERMTMAQALVRFLDNQYVEYDGEVVKFVEGVFYIYGHGIVVGLGEALVEGDHNLKLYQGHNEQGMAHVAIGYAKQKKRRQIFAVSSSIGPGALNMVTAAATASVNRVPLLLLPGDTFACRQPDPVLQQMEQFNDYSVTANDSFRAVSRYWDRIHRPEQLMTSAIQAMRVLTDPAETGAVTLALPQDVQGEAYDYPVEFLKRESTKSGGALLSPCEVEELANLIKSSKRPLLICGGGVRYSEAGDELASFSDNFNIPFAETQAGKGVIPWDHPLNLGGIGVTGNLAANRVAKEADLVISAGSRLSDFTTGSKWLFREECRIVSLNVNSFDAYKMNSTPIVADVREALQQVAPLLKEADYRSGYGSEIEEAKRDWKREADRLYSLEEREGLSQTLVLGELNETLLDRDSIVVGASGSLPGDLQRLWRCYQPETYHMEYGFSCMGYEIQAALGAKMACPEREVYALVGDGSYVMLHSEILMSLAEGFKINIVVFDNNGFQCIDNLQRSQGITQSGNYWQVREKESGKRSPRYTLVDFAQNGESYGAVGFRIRKREELAAAFAAAKRESRSVVFDIKVTPNSMSGGYDSWWRVGTAEVSPNSEVERCAKEQKQEAEKARRY